MKGTRVFLPSSQALWGGDSDICFPLRLTSTMQWSGISSIEPEEFFYAFSYPGPNLSPSTWRNLFSHWFRHQIFVHYALGSRHCSMFLGYMNELSSWTERYLNRFPLFMRTSLLSAEETVMFLDVTSTLMSLALGNSVFGGETYS